MSNADAALSYASQYVWNTYDGNTEKARWYAAHQAYLHALEVDELVKGGAPQGTLKAASKIESHMAEANMWANVAAALRK